MTRTISILCGVAGLLPSLSDASFLAQKSHYQAVSAEIISYDTAAKHLLATADTGVEIIDFSSPSALVQKSIVTFSSVMPDGATVANVSSVAADPLGRGFGAAVIIPSDDQTRVGRLVLFDSASGEILNSFDVGYHPDCVSFSPDGGFIVTANEGEWFASGVQTSGSVSVLSVGASRSKTALASLGQADCVSYDFSTSNLASGVSYEGIRVTDSSEGLPDGMEPEYVSCIDGKVYVSIQESSVIGVLDIALGKWTALFRMPALVQTIDASDKDGGVHIDDTAVLCLPMPDTIHAFEADGHTYIVTANEGDFRTDDGDKCRVADLGTDGTPAISSTYLVRLNVEYDGNALADNALGRLNVSTIDGVDSVSGEIVQLYVPGSRSFSVIEIDTGTIVWDSGSAFETLTASLDPSGYADNRSDDKGPEPEGICTFTIGSERYAAIVMERTYGIFVYNITNPKKPVFADYIRASGSDEEPESVCFISSEDSPDGVAKLVVSYEASRTINVFDLFSWGGYLSASGGGDVNTYGWLGWLYVNESGWSYSWNLDSWLFINQDWVDESGSWMYLSK